MYLLDTNVLSELRKSSAGTINVNVSAWAANVTVDSQFLSVIALLEVELGTLQMERKDPRQGALLRGWLENIVLPQFTGRILGVDLQVAQRAAALHVPDPCSYRDSLIAATALVHGLTVVTRNVRHFVRTGVRLLNPWNAQV